MTNEDDNNYNLVPFNKKQKQCFDELKSKGLISEEFNQFVRSSYHKIINEINLKSKKIDNGN